jgi:antitoxin HicB
LKTTVPKFEAYPFNVEPLKKRDGGGFVVTFPDLPGCMSDGETPEQAISNARDAFRVWMKSLLADGKPLPKPGEGHQEPSKFVLRLPRSLHARLTSRAFAEGVSLNSLVQVYVAEAVGRQEGRRARAAGAKTVR